MKKISILLLFIFASLLTYSQKTIAYADPDVFHYKDYSLFIKNAVSTGEYTKFRIKITNNSDGVIIYKPAETYVVYSDRKETSITDEFSISPNDKGAKTILFENKHKKHNEKSIAIVIGGLYIKRNTFINGEVVVKMEKLQNIAFSFTEDNSEILSKKNN